MCGGLGVCVCVCGCVWVWRVSGGGECVCGGWGVSVFD